MRGLGIFGLAGAALAVVASQPNGRIYGAANIKRYLQQQGRSRRRGSFDPVFNRNTGKPHEHAGEKARRARQAERVAANRINRAEQEATRNGFGRSRRGRLVNVPGRASPI